MKIFINNLKKNSKTIALKNKIGDIGNINIYLLFLKNEKILFILLTKIMLKNIPANDVNINKIIQSYFNLYFKDHKYLGSRNLYYLKEDVNS